MTATPSIRRQRWAWYLYDFGNSAFASVVYLAVFSAYFKQVVVGGAEGTRLWGLSIGIALFIVAFIAPVLGALADYSGAKKRFLLVFTTVAVVFTGLLFFVQKGDIALGMLFFILAEIGYRSGQLFYDAFLPEVAGDDDMGKISGIGWAVGSAGGVIALLIILPLVLLIKGDVIIRLSMVITAVFWAVAAIPLALWLKEKRRAQPLPKGQSYFSMAVKQVAHTISTAGHYRQMSKFMLAFLVYGCGVAIALEFAAIIGATLYGMKQEGIIIFAIIVQIANVVGAYAFGLLVQRLGAKPSLIASLVLMIGIVAALYASSTQLAFFLIGAGAGVAMAGIQSVSRTTVGLFAPPNQTAEFFGFFTLVGRLSFWIGPALFGVLAAEAAQWYEAGGVAVGPAEQQGLRLAILAIGVFLLIGLLLLLLVNEKKARLASRTAASA